MPKEKKRPSKKSKAAKKLLEGSKLLADKAQRDLQSGQEFKAAAPTPKANSTAMKARPHKKRG